MFIIQLLEMVNARIAILQKLIENKNIALQDAPEGLVNIAHTKDRKRYYFKFNSTDKKRKYIKKSEHQLVKGLCQKDYDEKVLQVALKEVKALVQLRANYPQHTYEEIFFELTEDRQSWVEPVELPIDAYVEQWQYEEYQKKAFHQDAPEYYTDRGERVRSKSEILIANILAKHNIPYKYECPLYLKGYGTIYPDFTVLNVRTREELYLEHMGKMDDMDYLEKALQKIELYEKNNIFPGERLILTHETSKHPMNVKTVENLILHSFK